MFFLRKWHSASNKLPCYPCHFGMDFHHDFCRKKKPAKKGAGFFSQLRKKNLLGCVFDVFFSLRDGNPYCSFPMSYETLVSRTVGLNRFPVPWLNRPQKSPAIPKRWIWFFGKPANAILYFFCVCVAAAIGLNFSGKMERYMSLRRTRLSDVKIKLLGN